MGLGRSLSFRRSPVATGKKARANGTQSGSMPSVEVLSSGTQPGNAPSDEVIAATPLSRTLHGWLFKQGRRKRWAGRYFNVDDERGTLTYYKNEKMSNRAPSVVLPLQDIRSVRLLEDASHAPRIVLSCPPIELTLAAEDREDELMWYIQLSKRIILWKAKASNQTHGIEQSLQPLRADQPTAATTTAATAATELVEVGVMSENLGAPGSAKAGMESQPPQFALAEASEATRRHEDPPPAAGRRDAPPDAGPPVVQGMAWSGTTGRAWRSSETIDGRDKDRESGSRRPAADRLARSPPRIRTLEEMISSDEEEDEEDESLPTVTNASPLPTPLRSSSTSHTFLSVGETRQEQHGEQAELAEAEYATAPVYELEAEPQVELPVMVGDGIRADSNFVDENWDSDDE